jgi:hypothetical protein
MGIKKMGIKKEKRTKLLLAFIFFSFLFLPSVFFGLSFCSNKAGKGGNNNQNNIPPKNEITPPDSGKNATSIIKEVKAEVTSSRLVILRWEIEKLGAPSMRKMSLQEKEKMSLPILFEVSRTDDKGDEKILGQTNQNSFVDSPEKAGKYCWKVKAKKSKEENELCSFDDLDVKEVCSEIKDGGDTEPPPPSPSNLKAERQGEKVILSWERKGRELGFKVQRCIKKENSDCSSDGFYVVGITEDTIFEDEILCVGSNEACWRVVAYNKGGESGYSNKVCLKLDCVYVLFWKDEDQDGYGSDELKICVKEGQMPAGVTIVKGDCDDLDPKRNPSSAEICDGKDNDCDLDIDEVCECKIGQERSCYSGPSGTEGVGVCKAGIQRCEGGVWGKCEGQVLPTAEICDGKDNDCDGQTDEGFNVGQICTVGLGECARTGQFVCKTDGSGTECNVVAGTPTEEICDGKDNDCDGKVDEADFSIQSSDISLPNLPYPSYHLGGLFMSCVRTNPNYPYSGVTREKESSNSYNYYWAITYYVINSSAEWKELCKNYSVSFDINNYVDFSTQTILGFVMSTNNPYFGVNGCGDNDAVYIYILKGMENGTIYAGWEFPSGEGTTCAEIIYPPYYGAVATNRKISSQSSFVIRKTSNDFCLYVP